MTLPSGRNLSKGSHPHTMSLSSIPQLGSLPCPPSSAATSSSLVPACHKSRRWCQVRAAPGPWPRKELRLPNQLFLPLVSLQSWLQLDGDCDVLSFKSVKNLFLSAFKLYFPSSQDLKYCPWTETGPRRIKHTVTSKLCVLLQRSQGSINKRHVFAVVQREALLLDGVDLWGGGDGGVCLFVSKEKRIRGGEA